MPLQSDLHQFVQKNRADLIKIMSEKDVDALIALDSSASLSNFLTAVDFSQPSKERLIHRLISTDEILSDPNVSDPSGVANNKTLEKLKQDLLELIVRNLDPTDWYGIITSYYLDSGNLIERYINNDTKPEWLIDLLFTNLPSNSAKIALLTQNVKVKEGNTSIVTNTDLSFEKVVTFMSSLNDEEKMKVIMSVIIDDNEDSDCLLFRADKEGKISVLKDILQDERVKRQLEKQMDIVKLRNRSTHFLGIADKGTEFNAARNVTFRLRANDGEEKSMGFEGMGDLDAQPAFVNLLNKYQASDIFSTEFSKIQDAFNNVDVYASEATQIEKNTKYYQMNNFVIIPSGWPGHSISIAATDKYLVVGNRGSGMHPLGGCIIYHLEKPLTEEDIKAFTQRLSKEAIENRIESIVKTDNDKQPIIFHAFPLKAQKYGTCSIANRKAVVAGLIPLLRELRDNKDKDPEFSEFLLDEANKEFKRFTHFTRASSLDELMQALKSTPEQQTALMEGLVDYCNQHLDFEKASEVKLLYQLITTIPESLRDKFLSRLTVDANVSVRYLYNEGIDNSIPPFIKELRDVNSIIKPQNFTELHTYLTAYPGVFEELLQHKILQRNIKETPLMIAVMAGNIDYVSKLLADNANVNQTNSSWPRQSALSLAILTHHTVIAKMLIDHGANIDEKSLEAAFWAEQMDLVTLMITGKPELIDKALSCAMQMKNSDKVKWVLNHKPGPSQDSKDTAFCKIGNNSQEIAEILLLHGANVNAISGVSSPLISAIMAGNIPVVTWLIANGASVELESKAGTPLLVAGQFSDNTQGEIIQILIDSGADIHKISSTQDTAILHYVIAHNFIDIAKTLIGLGVDLRKLSALGETPITMAAKYGHLEIMKALIEKDPTLVNNVNSNGASALLVAINQGKLDIVQELIAANADINLKDAAEHSALYYAIEQGNVELAKMLIDNGALNQCNEETIRQYLFSAIAAGEAFTDIALTLIDKTDLNNIDSMDELNSTALLWAAQEGNLDIFEKLLEKGANIQHVNNEGWNALFYASYYGNVEIVNKIINEDPTISTTVNFQDEGKATALLHAVANDHADIALMLLAAGADPNISDINEDSPLIITKNAILAQALINNGASVDHKNQTGWTLLLYAVKEGNNELALTLLGAGADPNITDPNGDTPLMLVQDSKLAEELIHKGAEVNHQLTDGWSVLHSAVSNNLTEVALSLLEAGADPNVVSSDGYTPLMYVYDLKLFQAFISKGADIYCRGKNGESLLNNVLSEGTIDIVKVLVKHFDSDRLFAELSETTTMYHFNKLPSAQKQELLKEVALKLTQDQLNALNLAEKQETRPKSVVFRDVSSNKHKKKSVKDLIEKHEEKIREATPKSAPKQPL